MDMLSYGSNVTLPIRELDLFLGELCASGVPVNYIPGLREYLYASGGEATSRNIGRYLAANAALESSNSFNN
jgi:hypothetical protein